jgi:hypothetical protein
MYRFRLFNVILDYEDDLLQACNHGYDLDEGDFNRMWQNATGFLSKIAASHVGFLPPNYILSTDLTYDSFPDSKLPTRTIALHSNAEDNGWKITASRLPMPDPDHGSVTITYNKEAKTCFGELSDPTNMLRFLHSIKIPDVSEVISHPEDNAADFVNTASIWCED